ncbi:MAG TPA: hypothetical protein VGA70_14775 [Longimicrobiales bacterium]
MSANGRRMRQGWLLLAAALALLAVPRGVAAQVTRADSAAVLLETAERMEAQDDWEAADAILRLIVERYGDTPAADTARGRLAATLDRREAGSGRVELQVWSTTFGLWMGVAIPVAMGATTPEPYGLGLLVGAPVGFFGGREYARRHDVTEGQARAITLGGTWGTWQGFGWAHVFDVGDEEVCLEPGLCYENDSGEEEEFAAMIIGGLAGAVTGALVARKPVSAGAATSANFGSLWGSWFGVATGVLMDIEDDNLLAMTLVGGNVGLIVGAVGGSRMEMSRGRARLVSAAGLIGGVAGLGLDLLMQPDDEKVAIGIPLIGSVVGLGLGLASTRNHDMRRGGSADLGDLALLNVRDGRVGLGTPMPFPTLVEGVGRRGAAWKPALGVTLLRASF